MSDHQGACVIVIATRKRLADVHYHNTTKQLELWGSHPRRIFRSGRLSAEVLGNGQIPVTCHRFVQATRRRGACRNVSLPLTFGRWTRPRGATSRPAPKRRQVGALHIVSASIRVHPRLINLLCRSIFPPRLILEFFFSVSRGNDLKSSWRPTGLRGFAVSP